LLAYIRAGKTEAASALAKDLLAAARKMLPAGSPRLAASLAACGAVLVELPAWADAETVLRECLAIRGEKEPDDWRTFNAKSLLGAALLGQQKYADAEPLLVEGYEGMKKRQPAPGQHGAGPDPEQLTEALERLVQLYDQWEKPDQAARWRKELEKGK